MRRRRVLAMLYAVALLISVTWTEDTSAQAKLPRVGILSFRGTTDEEVRDWLKPFRLTLADQGWVEGKNVLFEYRNARISRSPVDAAAELVRLKVDLIFADSAPGVRAAHAATRDIPIVAIDFTTDPVAEGYVESHGRPGGNITGVFLDAPEFAGKWLQLLKAMVPGLSRVAVLWDPTPGAAHLHALQKLAPSFRVSLQVVEVRDPDDLDRAFSAFRGDSQALVILPSPMVYVQSERLAKLALKYRLPATSMPRQFADAGGTIAYGPDSISVYERCAVLVARILGGANQAELPLERPTKVQLIVNLKTAKALRLTVPESILYRADEVIR